MEENIIAFKKVEGGTHDMPALIFGLTNLPLFFRYADNGTIEKVDGDIDLYEGKEGDFLVHYKDYELAYALVELHDEFDVDVDVLDQLTC